MCGIAGVVAREAAGAADPGVVRRMLASLAHRGPDGDGLHVAGPAVLGHKRLAIIDLETGQQPMSNEDGSLWITFNGEIYNYVELRDELARHHEFRTRSDTEVILHLYEELGERCLDRLNGMFAFAIWDARQQRLFAARDRLGIKPFYWAMTGDALVFASEPKAILEAGLVKPALNTAAFEEYLTFQFCLDEHTLFRDIQKLEPGHYLSFRPHRDPAPSIVPYWSLRFEIDFDHTEDHFRRSLLELMTDAVRLQLRSDVAVGAHCSGGMDSSSVVMLAARQSTNGFHTFTGAFREGARYDESAYALLVAEAAHAKSHVVYPTAAEFAESLPWLIYMMDEPAAGPGLFPQYCVSRLARDHVKVVLGGQGGDELFGGYARYLVAYLEQALRGAIYGAGNDSRYLVTWDSIAPSLPLLRQYQPMLQRFWADGLFGDMDRRYFRLVTRHEPEGGMYSQDVCGPVAMERMFGRFAQIFNEPSAKSYIDRMTNFDVKTLLPALLQVEDRTSMSVSLESRVPLLDHRIAELVMRMPPAMRFRGGDSKRILREAMTDILPERVRQRTDKMGFPVPLAQWLQGPLRDFVHDILLSDRARQRGLYRHQRVEQLLAEDAPFDRELWGVLCLELWHRAFLDGDARPAAPASVASDVRPAPIA
jgi:asparagine synthase (glutamine-hydrolysing)